MERARMGFIMQGDLHISFLVVPMDEDVLSSGKKGDSSAYRAMEDIFTGMQVRGAAIIFSSYTTVALRLQAVWQWNSSDSKA